MVTYLRRLQHPRIIVYPASRGGATGIHASGWLQLGAFLPRHPTLKRRTGVPRKDRPAGMGP
jgi:hypothetical protein